MKISLFPQYVKSVWNTFWHFIWDWIWVWVISGAVIGLMVLVVVVTDNNANQFPKGSTVYIKNMGIKGTIQDAEDSQSIQVIITDNKGNVAPIKIDGSYLTKTP
jgi:hypothetical protein